MEHKKSSMDKKINHRLEHQIEEILEKLTTHPIFLKSVSFILNYQSNQKILTRSVLNRVLKLVGIPNKLDQERTLYLVHELQHRIYELEKKLARSKMAEKSLKKVSGDEVLVSSEAADLNLKNRRSHSSKTKTLQ